MKFMSVLVILLCSSVFAADDSKVKSSLNEISSAREQVQILFNQVIDNSQKERLRYVNDRLNSADNLLRQALGSPNQPNPPNPPPPVPPPSQPQPPNQPPSNSRVEMYHSDSCNGDLVGVVKSSTDCRQFNGAADVWAIKTNNKCEDINDTTAVKTCQLYKNIDIDKSIRVYKSDNCSSSLSAVFNTYTDCESLPSTGNEAWAARIDGQCQNISDTSVTQACRSLKAISSPDAVKIYHNDHCGSDLVAAVDHNTRCETLSGMADAWAVFADGKCQDISDLDIVTACNRFKP